MDESVFGHRASRGDQRLAGDLSTEDPLRPFGRTAAAENVHLDLLQVEDVEQFPEAFFPGPYRWAALVVRWSAHGVSSLSPLMACSGVPPAQSVKIASP